MCCAVANEKHLTVHNPRCLIHMPTMGIQSKISLPSPTCTLALLQTHPPPSKGCLVKNSYTIRFKCMWLRTRNLYNANKLKYCYYNGPIIFLFLAQIYPNLIMILKNMSFPLLTSSTEDVERLVTGLLAVANWNARPLDSVYSLPGV